MATGIYGNPCIDRHAVYITDRGGSQRVGQLVDISQIRWDRRRDETSEAQVIVRGDACSAQAPLLRQIEPKRSEMVIYRDNERVWEGPVNRVGWHADRVEIVARDVTDYLFHRPLSKEWDNSYPNTTEVTARMQEILEYELNNDFSFLADDGVTPVIFPAWESVSPPANIAEHVTIHNFPNEARTSALTTAFQMTVGEHLDNFARSGGIDYTTVGRAIHIWDVSRSLGRGRTLTEADFFGEVIVTAYGSDFAAAAFTVASDGRFGGAGSVDDYYGPWAKIFTVYDEDETDPPSQADLNSQAQRNLVGRNPVPIEVRVPDNSSLRLSTGLGFDQLVPGVQFPLLATLNARRVSQMQKLHRVVVTEDPQGETIQTTFVPASREDSNEEE